MNTTALQFAGTPMDGPRPGNYAMSFAGNDCQVLHLVGSLQDFAGRTGFDIIDLQAEPFNEKVDLIRRISDGALIAEWTQGCLAVLAPGIELDVL